MDSPMFVGEVRMKISRVGVSWTLSGGNQKVWGPTKSSKYLQVRRATARRKRSRGSRQNLVPGGGGWNNSASRAFRVDHNIKPAISALQSIGAGVKNQPTRRRATIAGGTRLRRRLSKIFQRLKTESGLGSILPSPRGTQDLSQSMICQSPRIQRCCLLHHAM